MLSSRKSLCLHSCTFKERLEKSSLEQRSLIRTKLSMMTEGYEMNCTIDSPLGNNSQEFEQPLCTKIEECKNELKNLSAKKNRMLDELRKSKAKHVELRRKVSILKKLRRDDGSMTNGSKIAELKEEIRELREAKRKRDLEVCQMYMESQARFKEALEEKLLASTMRVMVEQWKKAKKARNY
ncbi:uncharacterized protein G2W53_015899 [Senna tora]|uniref:Uncharacterized protein n=1 Tax=Senna tora TaxID=362788 RepID=A0A835C8R4_9FABA|nr:uncharacterized protein G2W53_015899 [Senna tora]